MAKIANIQEERQTRKTFAFTTTGEHMTGNGPELAPEKEQRDPSSPVVVPLFPTPDVDAT